VKVKKAKKRKSVWLHRIVMTIGQVGALRKRWEIASDRPTLYAHGYYGEATGSHRRANQGTQLQPIR